MLEMVFNNKTVSTTRPALVMGIVNVTKDSFYKNSRGGIERSLELIKQGADIIDIGGESTRPGYTEISAEEQIENIIPVIKEIRKNSNVIISIDTRSAKVFEAAFEAGADILNDVSALEDDEKMIDVLKKTKASVILMHRWPEDKTMMDERIASGKNNAETIIKTMNEYLSSRVEFCLKNGISKDKIILDPGIGFGKNYEENIALIKNSGNLLNCQYPVLMALSRKRCTGQVTKRECPVEERLASTLALDMIAVQNGSKIVRVHDVVETLDTLNVLESMI